MITHPFSTLLPLESELDVYFFRREDGIDSDAAIARFTGSTQLVGLQQVHGNRAVRVSEASERTMQADAVATDVPGLTLTIRFADCQNALIYAPKQKVVCLVHAGWRGVRLKVMTSAFLLLQSEWNIDPKDTLMGLGPSLCTSCAEFSDPSIEAPELTPFIRGRCIDLRAALDAEFKAIGVPASQVHRMADCTRCVPETYWTFRGGDQERVQAGLVNALAVRIKE